MRDILAILTAATIIACGALSQGVRLEPVGKTTCVVTDNRLECKYE